MFILENKIEKTRKSDKTEMNRVNFMNRKKEGGHTSKIIVLYFRRSEVYERMVHRQSK